MRNTVLAISLVAVLLYFYFSRAKKSGKSESGEISLPPIPNLPDILSGSPLSPYSGEGKLIIDDYVKDIVLGSHDRAIRIKNNIGLDMFPITRNNVSQSIRNFALSSSNSIEDIGIKLIPETINPEFKFKLKSLIDFCEKSDSLMKTQFGDNYENFANHFLKLCDFTGSSNFRLLPASYDAAKNSIISKYGECKGTASQKRKCTRANWVKLSNREILAVASKILDECVKFEKAVFNEALIVLSETYNFVGQN